MKCPVCHIELRRADRQGVEIDYCPECRGIWLDRGELEKLIERSTTMPFEGEDHRGGHYKEGDRGRHQREEYRGERKRKSFLGELFDF
ncbi:zf-TFIIB domain-containing protein [Nostoc cycadae]|uniref:Recombination protein RecR n=1 Tax=Nostoc cycadae WK-1 TaxID=1861711 RepID=A0A2H6LKM6_9NOSO|nr:zf-TFIIB domain-containing protein [Nostoc cycadae]GBE93768.1 recombination protein RecR [Nostoc cycadae WK-1]